MRCTVFKIYRGSQEARCAERGIVQFAKMVYNTKKKVAIKFFLVQSAFDNEEALYRESRLHKILPPIDEICRNDNGAARDPCGRCVLGDSVSKSTTYVRHVRTIIKGRRTRCKMAFTNHLKDSYD